MRMGIFIVFNVLTVELEAPGSGAVEGDNMS